MSKLIQTGFLFQRAPLSAPRLLNRPVVRVFGKLIPPTQYDTQFPRNLRLGYSLRVHWELIPLVAVAATAVSFALLAIAFAVMNKVDVVFKTHSQNNISRTMDLRKPTTHKMLSINQYYEPWPEMADVLDKMKKAEERTTADSPTQT